MIDSYDFKQEQIGLIDAFIYREYPEPVPGIDSKNFVRRRMVEIFFLRNALEQCLLKWEDCNDVIFEILVHLDHDITLIKNRIIKMNYIWGRLAVLKLYNDVICKF